MGRRSSQHHRLPRSRCKEFNLDQDDPRNIIVRDDKKHKAYHELFGNKTPEEAVSHLFLEWFPPTSFFSPKFIKNKNLRKFFMQIWDERNQKSSNSTCFCCKNCGGRVVKTGKLGQVGVYNCEQCGGYQCFSCMLCLKPARIAIDPESNLYICDTCISGFVKKIVRLPKKFKAYAHIIWKIWIDSQQNQEKIE